MCICRYRYSYMTYGDILVCDQMQEWHLQNRIHESKQVCHWVVSLSYSTFYNYFRVLLTYQKKKTAFTPKVVRVYYKANESPIYSKHGVHYTRFHVSTRKLKNTLVETSKTQDTGGISSIGFGCCLMTSVC